MRVERETVEFEFPSIAAMVEAYSKDFGPFVVSRRTLEPEGRWEEFIDAFAELANRFNLADDGTARISSDYLLTLGQR